MRRTAAVAATVIAGLLVAPGGASAAVDMFLEAPGTPALKGDSRDRDHRDAVDVLAFSTAVKGGDKKVAFEDLSFTKYMDRSSPALLEYVASGQLVPEVKLFVRKAGENPIDAVRLCYTGVRFTSLSFGGSGGEDRLTENVTFAYQTVVERIGTQGADGKEGTPVFGGWDIVRNLRFGNPQC